ncbi:MAG TPA: radical SAM protein [Candidatus Acidoferrales bacterium]|nr:radical SAM protein [Candidatus Acidoferrales bacterium]
MQPLRTVSLQRGIIYGPVRSRRLGVSLGINLLPTGYKLCSFNCVYCQYGWTFRPTLRPASQLKDLPRPKDVSAALEKALEQLSTEGRAVDSISICGNGEPTLYPELGEVVEMTKRLRDKHLPDAKVAIFSNSSTITSQRVRTAVNLVDLKIMKLDAGSEKLIRRLNHPAGPVDLSAIVDALRQLNNVYIQSMFVQGRLTNADPVSVAAWVDKIGEIRPALVQVYTLDRAPADSKIHPVSLSTLCAIANLTRWRAGVPAEVY